MSTANQDTQARDFVVHHLFESARTKALRVILVIATVLLGTNSCLAQSHVSSLTLEWGSWKFCPTYDETDGTVRVNSILALANPATLVGDNIVAVWYIRNADGTWQQKSWMTADPAEAIKSVKELTGTPAAEDDIWLINSQLTSLPSLTPEQAKEYDKGLLIADPIYSIVATSPDATQIVQFLAEIGYKAADIAINRGEVCTPEFQLETIATATEWGDQQSTNYWQRRKPCGDEQSTGLAVDLRGNSMYARSNRSMGDWTHQRYWAMRMGADRSQDRTNRRRHAPDLQV